MNIVGFADVGDDGLPGIRYVQRLRLLVAQQCPARFVRARRGRHVVGQLHPVKREAIVGKLVPPTAYQRPHLIGVVGRVTLPRVAFSLVP